MNVVGAEGLVDHAPISIGEFVLVEANTPDPVALDTGNQGVIEEARQGVTDKSPEEYRLDEQAHGSCLSQCYAHQSRGEYPADRADMDPPCWVHAYVEVSNDAHQMSEGSNSLS